MPYAENFDFNLEKQRAAERLREIGTRSKYRYVPNGNTENRSLKPETAKKSPDFLQGINIPFLSDLNIDSDIALILGLVLILSVEKSDKLLLLALLYILI